MKTKMNPKENRQSAPSKLPEKARQQFDDTFRRQAVALVKSGRPVKDVARELGVSPYSIYEWQRKFRRQIDLQAPLPKSMEGLEEEIERLREALFHSQQREEILKKPGHFRRGPAQRFVFLETLIGDFPLQSLCEALELSPSGYYAWKRRKPSQRVQNDRQLSTQIALVHARSRQTYGSPRVRQERT